jgi:hypothetical protein
MAQDITAEADSGGHTDNRPALTLLPTIQSVAARMQQQHNYPLALRVGLGGGIGTPQSAAAAFSMGAAWIMVGSVHQACVESGTSDTVRTMLAETRQADVTMAPAADMFEMGVTVQVLKRGTMFAMRAAKLYEIYRSHDSLESIPSAEREKLEKTVFLHRWSRSGNRPAASFNSVTRVRWSGPSATPNIAWHWCSAGTWDRLPTGPRMATPNGPLIIRSGAALPWGPLTNGSPAVRWKRLPTATQPRVARNILWRARRHEPRQPASLYQGHPPGSPQTDETAQIKEFLA